MYIYTANGLPCQQPFDVKVKSIEVSVMSVPSMVTLTFLVITGHFAIRNVVHYLVFLNFYYFLVEHLS